MTSTTAVRRGTHVAVAGFLTIVALSPGIASARIERGVVPGEAAVTVRVQTDWPQYHFDAAHVGFNPNESILQQGDVARLTQVWARALGAATPTSTIALGPRLFATSAKRGLVALRRTSGAIAWSATLAAAPTTPVAAKGFDPQPDPPGKVFVGTVARPTGLGVVYGFSDAGQRLWTRSVRGGVVDSPVVVKGFDPQPDPPGKLFVGTTAGVVYGLSTHDGSVLCSAVLDARVTGSPAAVHGFDPQPDPPGRIVVGTASGTLYALRSSDCGVIWTIDVDGSGISGAPAVADLNADGSAEVVAGSSDGSIYAMDQVNDRPQPLWSFDTGSPIVGAPVVVPTGARTAATAVFAGNEAGDIYAIGEVNERPAPSWTAHLGLPAKVSALANGLLYVACGDGSVRVLAAADGEVLFASPAVRGPAAGEPIVVDGSVFFGAGTGVRGYGVPDL